MGERSLFCRGAVSRLTCRLLTGIWLYMTVISYYQHELHAYSTYYSSSSPVFSTSPLPPVQHSLPDCHVLYNRHVTPVILAWLFQTAFSGAQILTYYTYTACCNAFQTFSIAWSKYLFFARLCTILTLSRSRCRPWLVQGQLPPSHYL